MKLMEKIIRAKIKLEGMRKAHGDRCMIEMDPEYFGPCTCGATASNSAINAALKELDLDE